MERVDCIVAGAGVVGLAIARELAARGCEVLVVEAERTFGTQTSARNNEVIHAGFLYPPGSLKAQLCREGRDALYAYCTARGIAHRRIGKLMIATSKTEDAQLDALMKFADAAGVADVARVGKADLGRYERNLQCVSAIYSPSTGVVDTHALMLSFLGDTEHAGGQVSYCSRVLSTTKTHEGFVLNISIGDGDDLEIACDTFVNAAGLGAADISRSVFGEENTPKIHFAKGNFFSCAGKLPFKHLIVPVGETLALGGAFTIDIGGQGKFGPDLEWAEAVDYAVDPARTVNVLTAIRRFYPEMPDDALQPGYSGIRPRVSAGSGTSDWLIQGPSVHGLVGGVNLLGIDTPGLTASLAIAAYVAEILLKPGV